jgi:tetratricopeptide (TPR) repeat protein
MQKAFYFCCMKGKLFVIGCTILMLASCKDEKKRNGPALENLQDMVSQHPDSPMLRYVLVTQLDSAGRYKEALAQLDELIKLDSLNDALWYQKGKIQENLPDTAGAILSFNRAARVYPSAQTLLALANLYAETRDAKVMEVCNMVDQMKLGRKYDGYTSFFIGVYYARKGENSKAIIYFDKSINNNYTLMDTYIEKGSLYYEQKNYAEAMKVFKTATTINNTFADGYYWQGKCYEALKDKPNAMSSYSKAFALDKKMKEAEEGMNRMK